jgi:hypothetical protein
MARAVLRAEHDGPAGEIHTTASATQNFKTHPEVPHATAHATIAGVASIEQVSGLKRIN